MDAVDLPTPAERIAFAIHRSGKKLEALAAAIGCSHAALSQWQTGATNVQNIKAGLLQAFADQTGVDVRWILSGEGPVASRYLMSHEMERVATALSALESTSPDQIETIIRMIEAAAARN
jgi:transcriptional regulator with XRE-family HTH domain